MISKNRITLLNIASTLILQTLAFLSGPIFSAKLGPHNYGVAAVYLSWVQLASYIFPLNAAGTVAVSRVNYPLEEQPKYQSSVLTLATLFYTCFSVLTIVVTCLLRVAVSINLRMVLIGLLHGWGLYCVSFMNSKLTYEFKAGKNFLLSIITSVTNIGLSLFFIRFFPIESNYWGRIIGQSCVYTLIGLVIFIIILKNGKMLYSKEFWSFTLPIAIPTVFHLVANVVLNQSDRVMLQGLVNSTAAGIYALACTFSAVLNSIWSAFNNSWVPFYYEYTKNKEFDNIKIHSQNYIELFTIITIGFILLSREVFHIYAKESFWDGTDLIPFFAIGYYFIFLYSFPVNYEFYNKKTKTIAVGTSFAAVCNIILNFIGIKLWGIMGAVLATAISHGLQFGFHFVSAKRINPGDFPFSLKDLLPGLCAVLVTCFLYWVTKDVWIIRWLTGAGLGIYLLIKIIRRKEIF